MACTFFRNQILTFFIISARNRSLLLHNKNLLVHTRMYEKKNSAMYTSFCGKTNESLYNYKYRSNALPQDIKRNNLCPKSYSRQQNHPGYFFLDNFSRIYPLGHIPGKNPNLSCFEIHSNHNGSQNHH